MWVFVVQDPATGARAYCSLNEGLGRVLRYGAYSADVLDRLHWMADVLGSVLQTAVRRSGPIDLAAILAQMLQMGDEAHNRNRAGTLLLLRQLIPAHGRFRSTVERGRRRRCASSAATTTSSSTSPCRRASLRWTPPAKSTARPWSWRWRATARTSASR